MPFTLFKKYPQGFGALFFTQAFFNFSFYGLKSIFILYVIDQLSLSEKDAISLFATLMALSYGASIAGSWISDNSLGTKNTIILGGILQALGIFVLMFSSQESCFFALALISLGSGFFKPTLATSVGMLFENPKDFKKDKAYSTFYIALNLGSFLAPLLCGFVGDVCGGYYNSLILIIVTLLGGAYLFYEQIEFKQTRNSTLYKRSFASHPLFIVTSIIGLLLCLYLLFKHHGYFDHLMGIIALGSFIFMGTVYYQSNTQERKDIGSIVVYILIFACFCSLFEQAGSSLMLFFDKAVDRHILGMEFPASALLSLSPIFVLICTPLLILFSEKVLEKKQHIDGLIKIGVGFILVALSFLILALSCIKESGLASPFWVVSAIFVQTLGELWVVPIGFSNISKLAPPRFKTIMMSFWLMAISYGHYFGGFIAQFSLTDTSSPEGSLEHYHTFFLNLSLVPCVIAILVFLYHYIKHTRDSKVLTSSTGL